MTASLVASGGVNSRPPRKAPSAASTASTTSAGRSPAIAAASRPCCARSSTGLECAHETLMPFGSDDLCRSREEPAADRLDLVYRRGEISTADYPYNRESRGSDL